MSEQKPYDATPAKRDKALREGNAARSQEIGVVVGFAAAFASVVAIAPTVANSAREAILGSSTRVPDFRSAYAVVGYACVPLVAAAVAGIGVAFAQGGGLRVRAVTFAPKHLAPHEGLKRMFGREAVAGAVRAFCAFVAASVVGGIAIRDALAVTTRGADASALVALAAQSAIRIAAGVLVVGALFAVSDYALARKRWLDGLKMTHDELKRDMREQDGDPHTKGKRKQFHRALVRGSLARVAEAAFVVVNPTHIAIALAYDPPRIGVPEILVRAADEGAATVRKLAREHRIPIVENVALARALYADGESGRAIPQAHYLATAQIVAELARTGVLG